MKVTADPGKCVVAGQCIGAAPTIFDQNDQDGAVVLIKQPDPSDYEAVRVAASLCPALAITIEE
jgi:ferredoxin